MQILAAHGWGGERLMALHGGTDPEDRERIKAAFQAHPEVSPVRILLATDAASEGIDLQNHCNYLIHIEIPWNPNVMEQRNGRIDRHGQRERTVYIWHPVGANIAEGDRQASAKPGELAGDHEFLMRAVRKVDNIRQDLGCVGSVIARQIEEAMLGKRTEMDTRDAEAKASKVRRFLVAERRLQERIGRLHQRILDTREGLHLTPERVGRAVSVALEVAGKPPLAPVELRGSKASAFEVPLLTGSWAQAADGLAHPHTGARRPITFDHSAAILCAEERGLLLLGDPVYDQNYAVSTLRGKLREDGDHHGPEVLERRHDAWSRLLSVFRAVYGGVDHEALRLPALGGSIFDPDRFPFLEGRGGGTTWREEPASPLPIDNRTVLLLLTALQVLEQRGGARLLSYRALDVEQIGHVYEGLLEYTVERVPEITLALTGSHKVPHPTITLAEAESLLELGSAKAAKQLAEMTGRSESALKNALERDSDEAMLVKLIQACGGNEPLARKLLPFGGLIRSDSWGHLLVYQAGMFAIAKGSDRRSTGTHYTPRSLTEPIVQHTLESLVYDGPADGTPRDQWKLRPAPDILALNVCDMACGSGAFLVEACRYLAQRLVEAWAEAEDSGHVVAINGVVHSEAGDRELMPSSMDDRLLIARRLVAQSCIHGVDKNHLAVELAKLSLWLVTLAKNKPFGFLDHAIATSDRQRVQEDDPRYTQLMSFLKRQMTQIERRWTEWRKKHEVEKAKETTPALAMWLDSLPVGFRGSAETLIAKLSSLPIDEEDDRKLMYKHGIMAFERMKLRGSTEELAANIENVDKLLGMLADRDALEATLYRDIVQSRLDAIKDFQKIVDEDAKEKVLQKYLFDHLWLLDASWERATASEIMESRLVDEGVIIDDLTEKEKLGRVDIAYRTAAGKHIIVELKKAGRQMKLLELQEQGQLYVDKVTKVLRAQNITTPDIEVIFVIGKPVDEEGQNPERLKASMRPEPST